MTDHILKYGPWALLGCGFLFFAYLLTRYGFKGAVFGGRILRTFGEVPLQPSNGPAGCVRVHEISRKGASFVGIEIVQRSVLSYDMTGITISRTDADALIRILGQALRDLDAGAVESGGEHG